MIAIGILFFQISAANPVAQSERVLNAAVDLWRIESAQPWSKPPLAIFSADGTRLAIVVSRGRLADNLTESELRVYPLSVSGATSSAKERVLLRRTTGGNFPAIDGVRWLEKAHAIAFLGMPPGGMFDDARQVYVFDERTGKTTQRTHSPTTILAYGISDDGANIVYVAKVAVDSATRDRQRWW